MAGVAPPVDLRSYIPARDRERISEIIGAAQLVQAYAGLPRAQFLRSREDQRAARTRLQTIAKRVLEVSQRTREAHDEIPWDELDSSDPPDDALALWHIVKRVVPRALSRLRPLVARDTPATVFLLEMPAGPGPKLRPSTAKRRGRRG